MRVTSDLRPGYIFVDIGANIGIYSKAAAQKIGGTGMVLAVEPNPALLGDLKENLADLRGVRIAPLAVGESRYNATLHIFKQHTRSSLLRTGRVNRYTRDDRNRLEPVTVPVVPLLSLLIDHDIHHIDALKIDIEGYEDRALIPFFNSAPESLWPKRILIEINTELWGIDCISHLESLNYRVTWRNKGDCYLFHDH